MALDLKSIGSKLQRCRDQLQLSHLEVAQGTGIEAKRISVLERGEAEPSGDEILIFSDYYKQDYRFFISNEKVSASEQIDILYRKFGSDFTKNDRWIIQEFLFLCECEQFVWDELKLTTNKFYFRPTGTYFKAHGQEAAAKLRAHLGYASNELVKDLYQDLRKSGIHIFRRRLSNSDISGLFVSHPTAGKCILVNYDEDIYRQNFTLAHEIGHSIFDLQESVNVSKQSDIRSGKDLIEIRANTFASNFLIPKNALQGLHISRWSEEIILKLARQLRVNVLPLLTSLKEARLLSENDYHQYFNLKIPISEKEDTELRLSSGKLLDAKSNLLEKGLSLFYINKSFEAYSKGIISGGRLAEMFLTNEDDLPNLLNPFALKLNYAN